VTWWQDTPRGPSLGIGDHLGAGYAAAADRRPPGQHPGGVFWSGGRGFCRKGVAGDDDQVRGCSALGDLHHLA